MQAFEFENNTGFEIKTKNLGRFRKIGADERNTDIPVFEFEARQQRTQLTRRLRCAGRNASIQGRMHNKTVAERVHADIHRFTRRAPARGGSRRALCL